MIWGKSIFPTFAVAAPMPPAKAPGAYTPEQVEALASAMWQLLDDMGENGTCVCGYAKALAPRGLRAILAGRFCIRS